MIDSVATKGSLGVVVDGVVKDGILYVPWSRTKYGCMCVYCGINVWFELFGCNKEH